MEKFVPYEKLSKKGKRKMDLTERQTRGELKPENSKAYNRGKARDWKRECEPVPGLFYILTALAENRSLWYHYFILNVVFLAAFTFPIKSKTRKGDLHGKEKS